MKKAICIVCCVLIVFLVVDMIRMAITPAQPARYEKEIINIQDPPEEVHITMQEKERQDMVLQAQEMQGIVVDDEQQ